MRKDRPTVKRDSAQFEAICRDLLRRGLAVRFTAHGESMRPNLLPEDQILVAPVAATELKAGQVVFARGSEGLRVHRIVRCLAESGAAITRSDTGQEADADAEKQQILGRVVAFARNGKQISTDRPWTRHVHGARKWLRRLRLAGRRRLTRGVLASVPALILLQLFVAAAPVQAVKVTLTQTASVATVSPGGQVTYTDTLTNNSGANPVNNPVITQPTPANTTFVSVNPPAGWNCTNPGVGNAGNVVCTDSAPLAANGTATITVTVQVITAPPPAGGSTLTGQSATVTSTTGLTGTTTSAVNAGNTVTVISADLVLGQAAAPAAVFPGGTITFTETITNNGGSTAAAPQLTFTIPTDTTFQSAAFTGGTGTCSGVAVGGTGTETCTASGTLANANTLTISIVVMVNNPSMAGQTTITGTAMVSSTTFDPNLANNSASNMVPIASADLTMSQITSVSVVDTGVNFTYTEIATNNGPSAIPAGTLVVYQQTPPNTTLQSITVDANWNCPSPGATGPIICTYAPALASGANTSADTIVFTLQVNAGTADGTTILNSATVTSQIFDPVPSNNTSITTVLVESATKADLAVSMTAAPTPVFLFSNLTYTIQVQNLGQASAATVQLTDTIPAGTTFVSANAPAGWTCLGTATVTCSLTGNMAQGASATITISVTTPSTPGPISNTAMVSSATADPVMANNSATVITVVQPLVCATPGKDGTGGVLSGVVNTYYPGTGTLAAGATPSVTLGAASGAATPIAIGDLLLIMQMQDSLINSMNSSSYGHGTPGDPATGSTNPQSSGQFEYVTATSAVPVAGGTLTFTGTGANGGTLNTYTEAADNVAPAQQTFQVIRVPQYTSATLSSGLAPLAWTGSVGGVLALDVSSQLTLGGTVAADALGFRGGGGITARGAAAGADTDYVTMSPAALPVLTTGDAPAGSGANASKGEGIAGTPHWIAPAVGSIINSSTAISTAQPTVEGLPNGSYARGAPGNAGGGGTDGDPAGNTKNSGGGAGGNGGAGGLGGYGWNSFTALNSTDGGFGGAAFPATTSAIVMGGGGGAGTTNNGSYFNSTASNGADCGTSCTGIFSSGGAGGGIVIVHTGSLAGTGTITANGQTTLNTLNDSTGGGGAGGTIIFFANSGVLSGLTVNANGGKGGLAWSTQAPGGFSGQRHGPGGGGGGGVILLSGVPTAMSANGGSNGYTNTIQDSYGATPGQAGVIVMNDAITETPGAQPGAYCASADLAVTNAGAPSPVLPTNNITYTQVVSNNGPFDAVNAVFSEAVPANTTFQSIAAPAGWTCNSNASILATGNITCTNPDVPSGAGGTGTFTVVTQVNAGTVLGTQIVDVAAITSGTNDPNLANNTATAINIVGSATSAFLTLTKTANVTSVPPGGTITYTIVLQNMGPAAAVSTSLIDTVPTNTTFLSFTAPGSWSCSTPGVGLTGNISCNLATPFANGGSATFTLVVTVSAAAPLGSTISNTATGSSATPDPNPGAASATANVLVANSTQADLAVTSTATPNPVLAGNNITYAQTVTNNGPATATGVAFTDVLPTGTNFTTTFVSLIPPANWTCITPAVGMNGTISCTYTGNSGNFTSGTISNFTLVIKVSPTAPPGTLISNLPSVTATTSDPNLANNTVSCMVTPNSCTFVASPTQADVAIVKTANPEPVDQGANLTYTLQVTNNGPAVATGVSVSDPLPSQVTFTSVSTTAGTCAQAAGTVTCTLGSLGVGEVVIITINVNAVTFSSASLATNTATVTATTSDPDPGNNSSTVNSTIQSSTAVQLSSFRALARPEGGVLLEWHTREEIRNLGFQVYREDAQGRHRLNPSLIAGAALFVRGAQPQHGAKTYRWFDPAGTAEASYLLEDVDLNGTRTMHGPVRMEAGAVAAPAQTVQASSQSVTQSSNAMLLTQMNRLAAQFAPQPNRLVITPRPILPVRGPGVTPALLEGEPAVKISVSQEGWYRVTRAQLVAAGLNPDADMRFLQLYAEGLEQPMLIVGGENRRFDANESIEFYGTGIDTPYSDQRVYWMVNGSHAGKRILPEPVVSSGSSEPSSFLFTVIHEDRSTYFATLLNGENNDNFFGAGVTSEPVDQDLNVVHSDANSSLPVTVDVTLQGGTDLQAHRVSVAFNGASIGEMDFNNQANVTNTFSISCGLLHDGTNTVTLTSLDGDNDISLVQSIALHYPHLYVADSNWLRATAPAGAGLHFSGFSNPQIHVFDITDPRDISQLTGLVKLESGSYAITLALQNSGPAEHTLLAFSDDQISAPLSLTYHKPTDLADRRQSADIVIISHPDFVASLAPLVQLRESERHEVALVTIDQIFDAFNFGERSPYAIRAYLQQMATATRRKPQAVLLVGDASLDPRNYLGFGDFDFVPTRIIETAAFKTASDDWFTDFQQTGFPTIPTGRLPVRTAADAALVVSKIVNYERGSFAGAWNQQALLIADQNVGVDFSTETNFAGAALPPPLSVDKIFADGQDPNLVRQQILTALNDGALLVNYTGHGSTEQWSFSDLLDNDSAATLSNGQRLPVYLLMDCLNGFFHDVFTQSLAESLLLAPNGGAVAVWASSGFTNAPPQATLDQALLNILKSNPSLPLGQAVLGAKSGITDNDVRRTWILFGDPSMSLQFAKTNTTPGRHH